MSPVSFYVSDEVQNKIYRVFLDGRKEELIYATATLTTGSID